MPHGWVDSQWDEQQCPSQEGGILGKAAPEVSRSLGRFQRRRRQLRRRGAPARLPNVQLRLEQGEGLGIWQQIPGFAAPGDEQAAQQGLSLGWAMLQRRIPQIFPWDTTMLRDITLFLSQHGIQALFTSPFATVQLKA